MKKYKLLTYSMMNSFLACRTMFNYRYVKNLVPVEKLDALNFGSAVHSGLEFWFKYHNAKGAINALESRAEESGMDAVDTAKASVLLEKYIAHWNDDPFDVEEVEYEFSTPLINPNTNRTSHTFMLSGKVDGLVRMDGELFILEHKTAAAIDDAYIGRILIDSQIAIYANAISQVLHEPVKGAIYDILVKPKIRYKEPETEEAFEARKAELLAKSKTGKTTAKRQEGESIDEYKDRLREDITSENFRREIVIFSSDDLTEHLNEVWHIGKELLHPVIFRNTGNCMKYGRACPYLPLCREHGCIDKCSGLYEEKAPHEELSIVE